MIKKINKFLDWLLLPKEVRILKRINKNCELALQIVDGTALNKCIVELEKLEKLTTKNKDSLILLIAMYKKVYEITKHRFNNPSDPEKN